MVKKRKYREHTERYSSHNRIFSNNRPSEQPTNYKDHLLRKPGSHLCENIRIKGSDSDMCQVYTGISVDYSRT